MTHSPVPRHLSDTQLFEQGSQAAVMENTRMVLRKLRAASLPGAPPMSADWAAVIDVWAAELDEFDTDILEKATNDWIRTGQNFPSLPTFLTWCRRFAVDQANAARGSAVCPACDNNRYIVVHVGDSYPVGHRGEEAIAEMQFAMPCHRCPEMANRWRLFVDGHFDPDHEMCGRCREYRLPPGPARRRATA